MKGKRTAVERNHKDPEKRQVMRTNRWESLSRCPPLDNIISKTFKLFRLL